MVPLGLASAVTTRVGNALGRGQPEAARYAGLIGLALVLVWVGAKMLLTDIWKIPIWLSLLVIVGILAAAIGLSLIRTRPGGGKGIGAPGGQPA